MKVTFTALLAILAIHISFQKKAVEYSELVRQIQKQQSSFQQTYSNADSTEKDSILKSTRNYLNQTIANELIPYWYGTKWDFNGVSRTPGEGHVACGYFVTNILTDAGFNIPRVKWAQSASEVFIKKMAPDHIRRFSNRPISEVEKYLIMEGEGIYIVGLDKHVGFIVVNEDSMSFVHSNYYLPDIGVMSQKINSDNPLNHSDYRVIGKLMSDQMVEHWINHTPYN